MKIVEFENGKFAIRCGNWLQRLFGFTEYLDTSGNYKWYTPEFVRKYAVFDTLEEAQKRLEKYKQKIDPWKIKKTY